MMRPRRRKLCNMERENSATSEEAMVRLVR